MLCPAAVNAAAAAVWLLAVLGPGLSLSAEDNSDFSLCSRCFYRQTPPQGAPAGSLLRPLCHSLPGGQTLATLSKPSCDTAVYSAFHLSHGWTEKEGEELVEEDDNIKGAIPALLRGSRDPAHPVSDSPLHHWDSTVTILVQSSIGPQCSTLGGDLYILTGAGGLQAAEDGDEECQTEPLWLAVCCTFPEGRSGFSMGLIRQTGEGERQVSVKELGEILGVAELFSEGCGGADVETAGSGAGLHSEGLPGNIQELDADQTGENIESKVVEDTQGEEAGSGATQGQEAGSGAAQGQEAGSGAAQGEEAGSGARQGEEAGSGAAQGQEASSGATEEEELIKHDSPQSREVKSESPESSADHETVDEQETDTNSSSALVYILTTTLSILKAPLQPVFSKVWQFPGQVTYVLQEDLGVLSALPGETFSLVHLMTSDLLSWIGSAGETLLNIGGNCCSSVYYCSSSMLGALLNSCHTGLTGMGTLAGDTVGIFGGAVDNAWWVTKVFGGRLWGQSEGYVGTVVSEMGGQAKAVGGGLGRLVWRSGNGVGNVFSLGGNIIMGVMDVIIGAVRGAFGQESE